MPRKPQTEEKAKGLIGRSKGKKVEGAAYSVGNYKGRTLNLSQKQIASSGKKAVAASRQAATSISDTKFEKGKGVTKGGKAFTGKVDLGGGNIAVYVDGKRVRARAAKSKGNGNDKLKPPRSNYMTAPRLGKPGQYQAGAGMRQRKPSTISSSSAERLRSSRNADRKPANVSQSVWDRMSTAQKAALVAGLIFPPTRVLAALPAAAVAGNYVGTKAAEMLTGGKKKKQQARPLKMRKTYPNGK